MLNRKFKLAVPYSLLIGLAVYVFLDYYNVQSYDPLVQSSHYQQASNDSFLAREVDKRLQKNGAPSIGRTLYSGSDAISARLSLIERAEKSIDMQYFLMKPDYSGAIFADALIRAANRGVHVRFLLDDIFTTVNDEQIRLLASIDNIDIRIFNPLSRKVPRLLNYILDPLSINRRMHNKSLVVDGAVAVVGGRNIADEYYDLSEDEYFADLDILLAGGIVDHVAEQFDVYWNDEMAVSATYILGKTSAEDIKTAAENVEERQREAVKDVYAKVVDRDFLDVLDNSSQEIFQFDGHAVYDQPAKLRHSVRDRKFYPLVTDIRALMNSAESELIVLSPYFVPEDWGSEMFQQLAQRGVDVHILTNSLAATNHSYVHGGYYYRRPELLRAGVNLYEVRSDALYALDQERDDGSKPHLTLHTKLFIIDRSKVYIGSMNFDPRSFYLNTEFGVIIESPELANELIAVYRNAMSKYAYELHLVDERENWIFNEDNPSEVYDHEPAGFFRKFVAFWAHILPLELQY